MSHTTTTTSPTHLHAGITHLGPMIVSIELIESEALEAARQGKSLNDACRYPFSTDAGQLFKQIYTEAVEQAQQSNKELTQ